LFRTFTVDFSLLKSKGRTLSFILSRYNGLINTRSLRRLSSSNIRMLCSLFVSFIYKNWNMAHIIWYQLIFTVWNFRCYLQSGKISWLCTKHQNKAGITQLQMGTSSIHGTARVLIFEEDNLLKDLVLISPINKIWL
jgi:hypothetical protein